MAGMKAVVATAHGGAEVLRFGDVPVPRPGPGDASIEVRAAGVNNTDINLRLGRYASSVTGSAMDAAGAVPGADRVDGRSTDLLAALGERSIDVAVVNVARSVRCSRGSTRWRRSQTPKGRSCAGSMSGNWCCCRGKPAGAWGPGSAGAPGTERRRSATKRAPSSTGLFPGSAGRIRTYDQSVNSRPLYH